MTSTLTKLIVTMVLPLSLGGCVANLQPILTITNEAFPPKANLASVAKRIERATRLLDWDTEVTSPGEIIASKRKGTTQHVAQVLIQFDMQSFSIIYRSSYALDYDGTRVHKLYNQWVRQLAMAISMEMSPSDTPHRG